MTLSDNRPVAIEPGEEVANSRVEPTITVSNVSKWFGDVVSVNDISLEVRPGLTGLLGPNGAGKTTLLRMICGLTRPSGGEIQVFGEPVRNNPELYRRIGVMPEHQSTYDFMTGRAFVELNARLQQVPDVKTAVERSIEQVDMQNAQDRSIGEYSRGMKQRMRLAAVMVHDPEILLLDEPLSGSDPRQRIEFQELMVRLASEGRTIMISSHILEEVEAVADRILLDSKRPKGSDLPGGNGVSFDWTLLTSAGSGLDPQMAYMLSGGIDADNVAEAVRIADPSGIDVSSGVESAPGVKDAGRMHSFFDALDRLGEPARKARVS